MTVLAEVLREAVAGFPDRRAVVHGDRVVTYAQLGALADELAAGFTQRGVRRGHVVALVLPSGLEYVVAYLALARLGAVTTGVSPRFTPVERGRVLEQAAADLVVVTEELDEGVPAGIERLRCLVSDDVWAGVRHDGAPPPLTPPDPDDHETIVFTSGSTGVPKGALFTARQIRAITEMDTAWAWGSGGPQLTSTGLPHVGFMTKLAGSLVLGATMHVFTRWRAGEALRVVAEERMAIIGGVAAQISLLLAVPEFDTYDFSAVKGIVAGAGPSPAALVQEARRRFGAPYSIRYSSTESGGLGTLTAWDAPDSEALYTAGRPRPGTELEIRAPDGDEVLGAGEVGRICIRSPAVMAGYWRNPDATAAALDGGGWLRTDDLGWVGDDGCLRVTGRISEMYIRGGYNVYPLEVEGVLREHPAVASVVVVPRPDEVMGEIGVAVVVPRNGVAPPTLDDLRAFARERLAAYKVPEALRVVDAIPLTGMDKVDRRTLIAREREVTTP